MLSSGKVLKVQLNTGFILSAIISPISQPLSSYHSSKSFGINEKTKQTNKTTKKPKTVVVTELNEILKKQSVKQPITTANSKCNYYVIMHSLVKKKKPTCTYTHTHPPNVILSVSSKPSSYAEAFTPILFVPLKLSCMYI